MMDIKKWKKVTEKEFYEFVINYPKKLERDFCAIGDPPIVSYNDFNDEEDSIKAYYKDFEHCYLEDESKNEYFILNENL